MKLPPVMRIAVTWETEDGTAATVELTELEFIALIDHPGVMPIDGPAIRKAVNRAAAKLQPIRHEAERRERVRHEVWRDQ